MLDVISDFYLNVSFSAGLPEDFIKALEKVCFIFLSYYDNWIFIFICTVG